MTIDTRTADLPGSSPAAAQLPERPVRLQHTVKKYQDWPSVAALMLFLAVLPLEWITVAGGSTSDGEGYLKPFHIAAILFTLIIFSRWRASEIMGPVWRRHGLVYGAYLLILVVSLCAALAFPDPYLPPILALRQAYYGGTSLIIAGFIVLIIGRPIQRWLAYSGIIASISLMLGFVIALASQHTNPITLLVSAVQQADPDIITFQLLRTTFRTDDDLAEVAANLRHKVFIGLLIAVFFGMACSAIIEKRHRILRALMVVGTGVGCALVTLSLSRSTTLCMAVPFMLYPLRILFRDRARPAQAVLLVVAVASGLAVLISPIGTLLYVRFTATGSYTSRLTAAGPSFLSDFLPSTLLGATKSMIEKSPHNFVLNSWLGAGVVGGAAATALLLALAWLVIRESWRYLTDGPGWVIPVGQIWVIGIGGIPILRAFTAGNQFHMVEFTAIALFLGLTLANERAARALKQAEHDALPADGAQDADRPMVGAAQLNA